MTLGNKIAYYRKSMNITQDALARQLEVTNQAVSKWESDQCCPDVMLLPKIADIFGVTIDELFDRAPQTEKMLDDLPWEDDNILRAVAYVGRRLIGGGVAKPGFSISWNGDVDGVLSQVSVSCGNVNGDVDASGSVSCGNVDGDVDAGTDVTCGDVDGDVDAGMNVSCGTVEGDVDAGLGVTCENVGGDVNAGLGVECGNVEGDINAGGPVTIKR